MKVAFRAALAAFFVAYGWAACLNRAHAASKPRHAPFSSDFDASQPASPQKRRLTYSANSLTNYQSCINAYIVSNGVGAITGPILNQCMSNATAVFNSMGVWNSSGAFTINPSSIAGPLTLAQGGTGTATPSLIAGSNVTVTGYWPNQTIAASVPPSPVPAGAAPWLTVSVGTAVNFNAVADTPVTVRLPPGLTNYVINSVRIYNCTTPTGSAVVGLYTAANAGGFAILTVTPGITAQGPNATTSASNTTPVASWFNAATLYFRVTTAIGSAGTCSVDLAYIPLY